MLTEKQKQQLASWTPSVRTVEILDELRVFSLLWSDLSARAGVLFADKDSINSMPNDFDDLLSEVCLLCFFDGRLMWRPLQGQKHVQLRLCGH